MRLVQAVDDRGRECLTSRPQTVSSPYFHYRGLCSFRLQIPPGAKTLDLTVAPHPRSHFVEFLTAPQRSPSQKV